MSGLQKQLEDGMDEYLVKKAPFQIPENGRKAIVSWAPWIALVVGVLSLLSALALWNLANRANEIVDYANDLSRAFGGENAVTQDISVFVYVAIVFIVAQGVLLLAAFKGLQAKSKSSGWNLLLLSTVASFLYAVTTLFIGDYRSTGDFVFSLLGTVVGLYILAQIKGLYTGKKTTTAVKPAK